MVERIVIITDYFLFDQKYAVQGKETQYISV